MSRYLMANATARPTRKQVAELAEVAPSTVSLILNYHKTSDLIPDATRQRVFAAAKSLGYHPNAMARALVSGRTGSVGVVVHLLGTPFHSYPSTMLEGAWRALRPHGYRFIIEEASAQADAGGLFHDQRTDGLLILAPSPVCADGGELDLIRKQGFPAVTLGGALSDYGLDQSDIDNVSAGKSATNALLAAGHRRILHLSGPCDLSEAASGRLAGYQQAMREAGLPIDPALIRPGDWLRATGARIAQEVLAEQLRFTAIFAANDGMAAGAIEVLLAAGVPVPHGISVIGIDGFSDEVPSGMRLATIRQPMQAIGRAAGEMLLERMQGLTMPARQRLHPGEFILGNTLTACADRG